MVENTMKWAKYDPGNVKNIRFCNFDAPTVIEFKKAFQRVLKKFENETEPKVEEVKEEP
jgi:hypothetical protein